MPDAKKKVASRRAQHEPATIAGSRGDPWILDATLKQRGYEPARITQITPSDIAEAYNREPFGAHGQDLPGEIG